MNYVKRALMILFVLTVLPITILVVIAMQGRLDSEDIEPLRTMPIIGALLPEARPSDVLPTGDDESGGEGLDDGSLRSSGGNAGTDDRLPDIARDTQELERLSDAYHRSLNGLRRKRDDLAQRERKLIRLEEDVAAREKEVEDRHELVLTREDDLMRREAGLKQTGILIERGKEKSLKETAKFISEMDSEAAASTLASLDLVEAAKILKYADTSAVADILSAAFWADAGEQRKQLVEQYSRTIKPEQAPR